MRRRDEMAEVKQSVLVPYSAARMFELVELKVADLFRVRIGPLTLGDMPEGRWRPMTAEERTAMIGHSIGG